MRTSENARRMTVFFGGSDPMTGEITLRGTGFLVCRKEGGVNFGYLVTARHVAERVQPGTDVVIRLNTKSGGFEDFVVDKIDWAYHPDKAVDVAVAPVILSPGRFDIAYYALDDLVRPESSPWRVQCGDPIAIVGLFHWHSGAGRALPIVHSGNIALLPDANEKIPIRNKTTGKPELVEAYLVEAQTFDGLSGSPVFQREMISLRNFDEHNGGRPIVATGAQLLGVYLGAWEGEPVDEIKKDRAWKTDKRVPIGMGIVAPASRIMEIVLKDADLKKFREVHLEKFLNQKAAKQDSGSPGSETDLKSQS